MAMHRVALLFCLLMALVGRGFGQSVFINELHYDNNSTDTNEGVEIAGPAGTDLSGYDLVFYNGSNGALVGTSPVLPLTGTLANAGAGYGFSWFARAGIENGSPDGVALVVRATQQVVQFLSWEGNFTATAGVALGMLSVDIGVAETSTAAEGTSLQLTGTGTAYGQFTWAASALATPGQVNRVQTLGGVTYQTTLTVSPDILDEVNGNTVATATLSIAPPPVAGVTFSLANGDSTEISLPASVLVPTTGLVTFAVQAVNDGVLDGAQMVALTATSTSGVYPNATANVTVRDSQAPPPTTFDGLLRMAAFNVLNGVGSQGTTAHHAVREILLRLAPDVIAFEEVDDANTFADLKVLLSSLGFSTQRTNLVWDGDAYAGQALVPGDFASNGQTIVIASRYPIVEAVQIGRGAVGRKEMSRYPLYVRVDVPQVPAAQDPAFVAVHLKASSTDADRFRRLIEGYRIREFLTAQGQTGVAQNVFVLGDFNEQDEPGQPVSYNTGIDPLTHVFADDSKLPASYVLGADLTGANAQTLAYELFPHSALSPLSLAPLPARQADGKTTATYNLGGNARLDYIFAPAWMSTGGYVRTEIYNSRLEPAFDGLEKSAALPSSGNISTIASDHFCVVAEVPLAALPKLSVSLDRDSVAEGETTPITATVQLSQPASVPLSVALATFRPSQLRFANQLLEFQPGQTSVTTTLSLQPSAQVSPHREVTLQAVAEGWFPGTARLAVQNAEPGGLVVLSQYVENAGSGTAPKAVELLNQSGTTLDFSQTPLTIRRFSNGATTSEVEASLTTGLLGNGHVLVVGDAATGDYLLAQGLILPDPLLTPTAAPTGHLFFDAAGNARFLKDSFTYNGDDALEILLNYTRMDVFGTLGVDPGTAWAGSGVSTANQNISLKTHLGTGTSGFTDPSVRFTTVSTADALTGFGIAPALVDDYLLWADARGLAGLLRAPESDADGDGQRNLLEYALGTDPRLPNGSTLSLVSQNGLLTLETPRRTPRPGLTYGWEASTSLTTWLPSSLTLTSQVPLDADHEQARWQAPMGTPRQFWRLRVGR